MTLLSLALALAADPVLEVSWAAPFTLAEPAPWSGHAESRRLSEGWLVEVRASVESLRAVQVAQPVLYADTWPALRYAPAGEAPCTVVVVPAPIDLDAARWYFGGDTLPERITHADGARELAAAVASGVPVMAPKERGAPLVGVTERALAEMAEGRFAACRGAPAPRTDVSY